MSNSKKIPITVLCGFLGSGKTTLLNHLLSKSSGLRIAVIVNEFGAVNIDAGLVVQTHEKMIELSNGCICCTLRGDLLIAVDELLNTYDLDAIFIESTGIGEPLPIAQAFCLEPEMLELEPEIPNLIDRVYVDALITVVDSAQFFDLWNRRSTIDGDDQGRGYGELLSEQIEFANIILLNKTDLVDETELKKLSAFIAKLNPKAMIEHTIQGVLSIDNFFNKQLFKIDDFNNQQAWFDELNKEHMPESEAYGLSTYILKPNAPFDENRLWESLQRGLPPNILRSKGWVAFHDNPLAYVWNHSGRLMTLDPVGYWTEGQEPASQIVFIGEHLDPLAIEAFLAPALQEPQ